jgi:hypothetical protein
MTFYPDMGTETMCACGDNIRAIGWLHNRHPYRRGSVSPEFLERLRTFVKYRNEPGLPAAFGGHRCEFCGQVSGWTNSGVPFNGLLYVCPQLIVHYIEAHSYSPPDEFIAAVMHAPLPGTTEYRNVVESMFPWIKERRRSESNLKFFRSLGPEVGPEQCKGAGCDRKRIQVSAMCRIHHFEMLAGPCPFTDEDYSAT